MKREKVTMKDIAKELNLSLATVSYVLNHSEKERISHDTRFKVLETAKKLGYVPNQTARSLAKNQSNLIGIIVNLSQSASSYYKQQTLDLVSELQQQLHQAGYDTILSVTHDFDEIQIKYKHALEAAFIIDMDEKVLKKITKQYYVPVVFLDCDFDESLFYKILPDYDYILSQGKKILGTEQIYLVMDQVISERLRNNITAHFKPENVFIHRNGANLKEFLSGRISMKGIVIGDLLGMQVERYVDNSNILVLSSYYASDLLLPDTKRIITSNRQKAIVAMELVKKLIRMDYDETSNTRVLLLPDPPVELSIKP